MSRAQHQTTIQILLAGLKFRQAQDRFNSTLLKTLGHKDENARLDFLQRVKCSRETYIMTSAEIGETYFGLKPMTTMGIWNSLKIDNPVITVALVDSYADSHGGEWGLYE
jgi:hypothetical protein